MSYAVSHLFFFNDTATTEIYTLSLHDALPISGRRRRARAAARHRPWPGAALVVRLRAQAPARRRPRRDDQGDRSGEHTSELQSRQYLVCRLLLEKKTQISTPRM